MPSPETATAATALTALVARPAIQIANHWQDYQLLDCGDGMKEERWGEFRLVRPDPQIIWPRSNRRSPWTQWDGFYHRSENGGGEWEFRRPLPESWTIHYTPLGLRFKIRPMNFKHTGLFPEQAANWDWFSDLIKDAVASGRDIRVLNLFGYTGAATCAAAKAGAQVCHVDSAEGMVKWTRENAALSGLTDAPIRYLCDDCLKFVRREIRRERRYDAIIMDPPSYGRGSSGELWKLETHLWPLLEECRALLSDTPLFFLINAYTARLSPTVVANLLSELLTRSDDTAAPPQWQISAGEIGLPIQADGKTLPCGIFGRATVRTTTRQPLA